MIIKDAPTSPQSDLDSGAVRTSGLSLVDAESPSSTLLDTAVMGSGAEPENSIVEELVFSNVTDTQAYRSTLPGGGAKAKLTKQNDFLVQEKGSLPLKAVVPAGTWNEITFYLVLSIQTFI